MRLVLALGLSIVSTCADAQEIDSATVNKLNKYHFGGVYKSAVSFNLGGVTGLAGFTYDYFMSQHWRFEAGIGYYSVGIGFDYYPWAIKREQSKFKINLRSSIFSPLNRNIMVHSVGAGMTHFFRGKLNLGFDIGAGYAYQLSEAAPNNWIFNNIDSNPFIINLNIKLGYRFSVRAWKRKRELEGKRPVKS